MPTPFDTPHQIVPRGPLGTITNMLGFGTTPAQELANLKVLEDQRISNQQAAIWGPIGKKLSDLKVNNPGWGADKVTAALLTSPEWLNAYSTPGFDHANASENLKKTILSMYPGQPNIIQQGGPGGLMIEQPAQGASDMTPKVIGKAGSSESVTDYYGDPLYTREKPGQFNPNGLPMNPDGTVATAQPTSVPGSYTYDRPDGTMGDTPAVDWHLTADEAQQAYPEFGKYRQLYEQAAAKWGVPVDMLISQGGVESEYWNPEVVAGSKLSPVGAVGISQFMPGTVAALSQKWGLPTPFNPVDPAQAIDAQAHFMHDLVQKYQGDYRAALRAYNRGEDKYDRWVAAGSDPNMEPYETRGYVSKITGEKPRDQLAFTPTTNFKKRIEQAPLRPPSRGELVNIMDQQPGLMFAGRGLQAYVLKTFEDAGRAIDPSLASTIGEYNDDAKNRLLTLKALTGGLIPTGDKRVAAQVENYISLWPDDGLITDPIGATKKGIELFDFVTSIMHDRSQVTRENGYPISEVKQARSDYLKANRVRNLLGGDRQALVDQLEDYKKNRDVVEIPWFTRAREWVGEKAQEVNDNINTYNRQAMGGTGKEMGKQGTPQVSKGEPTATNPKTGEKMILRNGAWVPANAL